LRQRSGRAGGRGGAQDRERRPAPVPGDRRGPGTDRRAQVRGARFSPPLDVADGAARTVGPILDGFTAGRHQAGHFFEDDRPAP